MRVNCQTYFRVDFGHGPVEVRCTETGVHSQHRCDVSFDETIYHASPSQNQEELPLRRNVFERQEKQ